MAAGPKLIMEEFLRDAQKAKHALGYAPGCDLLEQETWLALNMAYTVIIEAIEKALPSLPEGTAEQIKEQRYGKGAPS